MSHSPALVAPVMPASFTNGCTPCPEDSKLRKVSSWDNLKDKIGAIQDAGCAVADQLMLTAANTNPGRKLSGVLEDASPASELSSSAPGHSYSIGSVVAPRGPLSVDNPPSGASPRAAAAGRTALSTTVGFKPSAAFRAAAAHNASMELPAGLGSEEVLRASSTALEAPGSLAVLANSVALGKRGEGGEDMSSSDREQVLDTIRGAASRLIGEERPGPRYGLGSMLQGSSNPEI